MKNKKIMILYASIGGGHYKAADAIKNYINEHYPNQKVEMIDALKYTNNNIADLKHNVYDLGMAILKYNYMDTMGDINNTKFTTILEQLNEFMANRENN